MKAKVGLFVPCYVNAVFPQVAVASYKLLKSFGLDVDYPVDQTCCGQPMGNCNMQHANGPISEKLFPPPEK